MRVGERWLWKFRGTSIKSDLVVEISRVTSIYVYGKCVQIIMTNDSADRIGRECSILSIDIVNTNPDANFYKDRIGETTCELLAGQEAPI